jgi:pimeloyl-ACP methyl ester carboxylesterase
MGSPYDAHAYDGVASNLAASGHRCIVPFLRGYGATRFLSPATPRSGEQAALSADLLAFMNALGIEKAILGGYDWGGRAACIVSALWPERVIGVVSAGTGYNICRFLWQTCSPSWSFDDATFERSAASFDNPDFVDVVTHSYRHRYGVVPGDPAYAEIQARLAEQPAITVPTVVLLGADEGIDPPSMEDNEAVHFKGAYSRHILAGIGHNVPQEASVAFADAVRKLLPV